MEDIKAYRPSTNSLSRGQVLSRPYTCAEAKVITKEMTESLVMELVAKKLLTDHITLDIVYDTASLEEPGKFKGTVTTDFYGRAIPKPSHGSSQLGRHSSSTALIRKEMVEIFDRIADPGLLVRRIYIGFGNTVPEDKVEGEQLFLFQDNSPADEDRERRRQEAILAIRRKYGKNAILKGTNFDEGATAIERNKQVGGHRQ